jgi:peptide/nickel transport system ATP-binding protein
VLTIKDLTITHPNHKGPVIENVSFSLKPGESLGIVGESGSGKTITALSILQLLPPGMRIVSGNINLETRFLKNITDFGQGGGTEGIQEMTDLTGLSDKQMRACRGRVISMIFQEPMTSLNPSMRCGEQIRESVQLHTRLPKSEAEDAVFSLLTEVHLPAGTEMCRKYPHQLSGGQRQRIMIAMALAGNPALLIADEPTTALDVTVQRKILDLLQEIRYNRMMGLLFISHDLGVIKSVCENALVMYNGHIVESGNVDKIFRSPGHPYTRGLIACRPVPGSKPDRLPTLADFMDQAKSSGKEKRVYKRKKARQSPDKKAEPILEARNLHIEYTLKKNFLGKRILGVHAVDNFSFCIYPGETVGLIGESGCGKSTLGLGLIRLIQSGTGEILYHGNEISSLKGRDLRKFRRNVQYIFQDPYSSLNPRMAIGPSIMEVMKVHNTQAGKKERKEATLELLGQVGLPEEYFERYPHEFSGGQRQRIGIARALAPGPELIICDESVSSLDVSVQAMILNLLNDLKEHYNLTYLFISHDLSVVRYMSERILVMREGKLVEEGDDEKIFSDPASAYTRELTNSIITLPGTPKT